MPPQNFITRDEFEEFKINWQNQHDLVKKLMNQQAIAIEKKLQKLTQDFDTFLSRKPDPAIVRDAWILRIPKIQQGLHGLQMELAQLKLLIDKKNGGVK